MKRRTFMTLAGAGLLAAPRLALAQDSERIRCVAFLISVQMNDPPASSRLTALRSRLRDLGWVEGRNIRYEVRSSEGDPAARAALAKELIALKPDVLVSSSSPDTDILIKSTRTIPIVFTIAADPVASGFVQSLARPGGNATGFTNSHPSMGSKWLEILKELAPQIQRIGVLFNPTSAPRGGESYLEPLREVAPSFGVTLSPLAITKMETVEPTIAAFAAEPAGGLVIIPDSSTVGHRREIVAAAARYRVPAIYPYYYFVAAGGLISYGFSYDASSADKSEVIVTMSEYIDLVLRGANPGEVPIRTPRNYELLINLKAAEALGLTVPRSLLARADRVF